MTAEWELPKTALTTLLLKVSTRVGAVTFVVVAATA